MGFNDRHITETRARMATDDLPSGAGGLARFALDWRPVAIVVYEGRRCMLDAERAAEVACGFAWDLGAAQVENERLRAEVQSLRGPCLLCGTGRPVDSQGICYPCFEDAMFAPDEEET